MSKRDEFHSRQIDEERKQKCLDALREAGITVRVAAPDDRDQLSELLTVSFCDPLKSSYSEDKVSSLLPFLSTPRNTLLTSGKYYVAETQEHLLVAAGGWSFSDPIANSNNPPCGAVAHIRHFATHPNWAGRSIGRTIFLICQLEARQSGVQKLEVYSTLNAVPFYSKLGFEHVSKVDLRLGNDLFMPTCAMSKTLP